MNTHDEILNIPCDVERITSTPDSIIVAQAGYRLGHRTARQEGAEVGKRADELIAQLLEALRFARSVIQNGEPWTATCVGVIGGAINKAEGK